MEDWRSRFPIWMGNFEGEKYRDSLPWSVQKQLNLLRCHLGYGLGLAQGTTYWRKSRAPRVKGQFWEPKGMGTGHAQTCAAVGIVKATQQRGSTLVWCGCWLGCNRWVAHWRHLANTIEPSVCGSDAALCQTTLIVSLSYHNCNRPTCIMFI